jgi:hypothetical protein
MRRQLDRYRRFGVGARVIERSRRRVVIALPQNADRELVSETVAIERECCPFFAVGWDRHARRLSFAVSRAADEPALEAILFALGLADSAAPA